MNDSLEQEESKNRLLEISKRISAPTSTVNEISLLKKGRILYEEDDIIKNAKEMYSIFLFMS